MASQRFLLNQALPTAHRLAEQRVLTGLYERLPGVRAIAEFQRARRTHVPTAELNTSVGESCPESPPLGECEPTSMMTDATSASLCVVPYDMLGQEGRGQKGIGGAGERARVAGRRLRWLRRSPPPPILQLTPA